MQVLHFVCRFRSLLGIFLVFLLSKFPIAMNFEYRLHFLGFCTIYKISVSFNYNVVLENHFYFFLFVNG